MMAGTSGTKTNTVAAPKPEPKRKRAPKVPIAGVPFHRRAFTWITELGPKRRAQAEDDAIEALSGEAKLATPDYLVEIIITAVQK